VGEYDGAQNYPPALGSGYLHCAEHMCAAGPAFLITFAGRAAHRRRQGRRGVEPTLSAGRTTLHLQGGVQAIHKGFILLHLTITHHHHNHHVFSRHSLFSSSIFGFLRLFCSSFIIEIRRVEIDCKTTPRTVMASRPHMILSFHTSE